MLGGVVTLSYKDEKWHKRIRHLGDEAEAVYELDRNAMRIGFIRAGLSRPPFHVGRLPTMERFRPDYIEMTEVGPRYIEVQGIGRDQIIKLKDIKWQTLLEWHAIMPVALFVWNNVERKVAEIDMDALARLVLKAETEGRTGVFDERNLYYEIGWEELSGESARAPRTTTTPPRGGHAAVGRSGVNKPPVRSGRVRRTGELTARSAGSRGDGADAGAKQVGDGSAAEPHSPGRPEAGEGSNDEASCCT